MILWVIVCILLAILVHEAGHMIVALLCGVRVETFSIGFGKPIWKKKIKGINFQITLFLLGGYTKLFGETEKVGGGFLEKRYLKKFVILIAGVLMNFLLACVCYWIHYKSITTGIIIDWNIFRWIFTKNYEPIAMLIYMAKLNPFLLQLSLINFGLVICNILPLPVLDGGMLWMVALEKRIPNFEIWMQKMFKVWFLILMLLQFLLLIYIFWL